MVRQTEWKIIKELLDSGLSIPKVAQRVGRSTTALYRLLKIGGPNASVKKTSNISNKLLKFTNYLDKRIRSGVVNSKKLFLEIKNLGYKGSYLLVNKYLKEKKARTKSYKPSKRVKTRPGQQAQVDWGSFGKIEVDGEMRRLYCFVYVLSWSRAMYIEFVVNQKLQTLEQCHINAFESLGIPREIRYDNIKTVVLSREILPSGKPLPHFNPSFHNFAQYYGFQIDLCPPYWPRAKGKVEAGIKYIRNNFMQGMKFKKGFSSLSDLNEQVNKWLKGVANVRIHSTTGKRPVKLWRQEKAFLRFPDKNRPYKISPFFVRRSDKDGVINYKTNFYSVPADFWSKQLFVREITDKGIPTLEIYHEDKLLTTHKVSSERKKWIEKAEHYLKNNDNKPKNGRKGVPRQKKRNLPKVKARHLSYYSRLVAKI